MTIPTTQQLRRILSRNDAKALAKLNQLEPNADIELYRYTDSLFRHCCRSASVDVVRVLVEHHGADVTLAQPTDGTTPLMAASTRHNQEDCAAICTYLLSQPSILPHVRDRCSRTTLMMAARQGHVSVVQQLVGADPSQHHVNTITTTTRQDSAVVLATRWVVGMCWSFCWRIRPKTMCTLT